MVNGNRWLMATDGSGLMINGLGLMVNGYSYGTEWL